MSTMKKTALEDSWEIIRELSRSQKETDRQLKELRESQQELNESQKKTDRQLQETNRRFNSQWGKLIESLVEGDLIKMLRKRNIAVEKTMTRVKPKRREGIRYEFDILAVNGEEVVAVEVKTTLQPKDTDYFIKKLGVFRDIFPEYSDKRIYGAVAYLREDAHADTYSEKKGLFVIRATGDSASITNDGNFIPKTF